jgi:hypothetical protein
MNERQSKFPIGTQFVKVSAKGKRRDLCTVVDIYRTYNSEGKLVSLRYVAEHDFMGQKVTDYEVVETTIVRALMEAATA